MKKLKKLLTRSIMVVLAFAMALAAPIVNVCRKVFAESDYEYTNGQSANHKKGVTFSVGKVKKNWTISDTVKVPAVDTATVKNIDGTTASVQATKVVVYDPNGTALEEGLVAEGKLENKTTEYQFKPAQIGTYTVEYAVKANDVWTVANRFELKVTASTYSYKFIENDPTILPVTIDTKSENVPDVKLPLPIVNVGEKQVEIFKLGDYDGDKVIVAVYDNATASYKVKQYSTWENFKSEYEAANTGKTIGAENTYYTMIMEVNTDTVKYINNEAVVEATDSEYTDLAYDDNKGKGFYSFKAIEGSNVIRYRLMNSGNETLYEESKKITGSNSYDSTKIDIGFTVNNATTKAHLDQKAYLPLASAYDKNNSNAVVSVYTIVEVKHFIGRNEETGELDYEDVAVSRDSEGIYFVPTEPGDYEITYKVKDFYGNEGYVYNYTIKDVRDDVAPTLYVVDSYDISKIDLIKDKLKAQDYKYIVPTKYNLDTVEITLPAVYAEDNSVENFENLTISRRITSSDFVSNNAASIYLQNDSKYTVYEDVTYANYKVEDGKFKNLDGTDLASSKVSAYKATQTATVKLDATKFAAGKYTIYYSVSDGNGNTSTWSTPLNLVKGFKDEVAPEITYQTNQTVTVSNNEKVTFDAPTITDDTDSTLINKYFIFFPNGTLVNGTPSATPLYQEVKLNKDGKIEFNTADTVADTGYSIYEIAKENGCTFTLATFSFDDFALLNNELKKEADITAFCKKVTDPVTKTATAAEKLENVGIKTTRIAVIDEEDNAAPVILGETGTDIKGQFNFDTTVVESYEQNGKIYVDGVKIWDNRKGLTIVAIIRDSNGNVVQAYNTLGKTTVTEVNKNDVIVDNTDPATDIVAPEDGFVYAIPGISFTASLCDSYTVTYVATDRAGSVAAYTAVLPKTVDKEAPVITGHKASTYELELGQTLSLVDIVAKDNDATNIRVEADCVDHSNYIHEIVDGIYEFAPQQTGTYKITFDATDGTNAAEQVTITVQVKHTVKPVIKLLSESVQTTYFGDKANASDFKEIFLPGYIVTDEKSSTFGFELAELKNYSEIKITGPVTFTEDAEDAKYKINYHKDNANNEKYSFKPTVKGTYTVTYSAWDEHNNEAEPYEIVITVGETVPPTINVAEDLSKELDKEVLVGTTLSVDLTKVTVTDNVPRYDSEGELNETPYEVKIQITDPDGKTLNANETGAETEEEKEENKNIKNYTFETAGDYVLTFSVTDDAGNSQVYTKTIKVVAEQTKKTDVTTVVGTILIVVSLAVLAGVIIYFAKTPKTSNMAPRAKKVEKKASKKDENKD